jgi:hypothetical protein
LYSFWSTKRKSKKVEGVDVREDGEGEEGREEKRRERGREGRKGTEGMKDRKCRCVEPRDGHARSNLERSGYRKLLYDPQEWQE